MHIKDGGDEPMARNVLFVVQSTFPYLQDERTVSVDFKRVMNSKKVSDHHAIIPTVQIENYHNVQLSDGELKILALISARLCMATAEKYQYRSIKHRRMPRKLSRPISPERLKEVKRSLSASVYP